jgi:hypothetical protein
MNGVPSYLGDPRRHGAEGSLPYPFFTKREITGGSLKEPGEVINRHRRCSS